LSFTCECTVPAAHPSLAGHFPGNPVVPGVIILHEVLTAVKKWMPDHQIQGFEAVKFSHPLKPDNCFTIELQKADSRLIKFKCHVEGLLLNSGTLILQSNKKTK